MQDVNSIVIRGRLVKDVELKHTNGGKAVMTGTIASSYQKKVGDEYKDEASFIDFSWFHPLAEKASGWMQKGNYLTIKGEIRQDRWEQDGNKRSKIYIRADWISKDYTAKDGGSEQPSSSSSIDFDNDIPF